MDFDNTTQQKLNLKQARFMDQASQTMDLISRTGPSFTPASRKCSRPWTATLIHATISVSIVQHTNTNQTI